MDDKQRTLSEQVGGAVRRWREDNPEVRQIDLVVGAANLGLRWSRSSVAELEAGQKQLSAEELLLLPAVLLEAGGSPAPTVDDLVTPARGERVVLGSSRLSARSVRALLTGDGELTLERDSGWMVSDVSHLLDRVGEPERKAALKLGCTAEDVARHAMALWGRSLPDERDARVEQGLPAGATARTIQAKRGHVTRQLITELRED